MPISQLDNTAIAQNKKNKRLMSPKTNLFGPYTVCNTRNNNNSNVLSLIILSVNEHMNVKWMENNIMKDTNMYLLVLCTNIRNTTDANKKRTRENIWWTELNSLLYSHVWNAQQEHKRVLKHMKRTIKQQN